MQRDFNDPREFLMESGGVERRIDWNDRELLVDKESPGDTAEDGGFDMQSDSVAALRDDVETTMVAAGCESPGDTAEEGGFELQSDSVALGDGVETENMAVGHGNDELEMEEYDYHIGEIAVESDPLSDGLKKLDAELTCPVCTEHFKEPKVLPCLHYYCKTCISDLIKRAKGQPFNCPKCRREAHATGNDPNSFPTAFFLNRMKDVYSVMKKADRNHHQDCESCMEQSSVSFCYDCKEYICTECVRYHKRIRKLSFHKVVSIESLRTNINKVPYSRVVKYKLVCRKHGDEALKLYCSDCHQLVCRDCVLIEHKDHKYAFVADTAPHSKADIMQKTVVVKKLSENIGIAVSGLMSSEKQLSDHETATIKTIDDLVDGVIAKAEEKRRELKEKAGHILSEVREKVSTQKKNAEMAVGEVESLVEFMNQTLERATDQEILSLEKQMSDQVERVSQLYGNPTDKFVVPTLPELVVSGISSVTKELATTNVSNQEATIEEQEDQVGMPEQSCSSTPLRWNQSTSSIQSGLATTSIQAVLPLIQCTPPTGVPSIPSALIAHPHGTGNTASAHSGGNVYQPQVQMTGSSSPLSALQQQPQVASSNLSNSKLQSSQTSYPTATDHGRQANTFSQYYSQPPYIHPSFLWLAQQAVNQRKIAH